MVPSAFVALDALTLTPNGKVDRKALPAPEGRPADAAYRAPRNEVETLLCSIVGELLGVSHVGIDDNFFDLGGHSLLATQFVSRVRSTLHVELSLTVLFQHPTVEALWTRCFAGASEEGAI
jgi:hypothetical protein